jgi:cytochrome c oxidase cbb3-type subunit 3
MLAFGRDGILTSSQIQDVVAYVQSVSGTAADAGRANAGRELFAANCVSCHGDAAKGMTDVGAPDLTDRFWIYGGDSQSIYTTVYAGRLGHMPHWDGRLSQASQKILALYVANLEAAKP